MQKVNICACNWLLNSLAEIATQEVKSTGVFTIPGVCKIKTHVKPATEAGKREVSGKVVKAFAVSALKKSRLLRVKSA